MTSSSPDDPYDVVLRDLRARRDQIDQAIAAIESVRAGSGSAIPVGQTSPSSDNHSSGPGDYLGMTIPEAAKKLLQQRRKAMGNSDIFKALKDGGLVLTSADPVNTIGSVLTRRFNQVGDIVRVSRGMWGLKEWYPNRTFSKKDAGKNGGSIAGDPTEPEPLSEPTEIDPLS